MATTTWKWADDVFGKQKQNPDNLPTQYPDCGPSRVYTLENILYGLENVITPLLQGISAGASTQDTSAKMTLTTSYTSPTPVGAILKATIWLLSTATEGCTLQINSGAEIFLEAGYSMQLNLTSLDQISAKSASGGQILYIVYTEAI